MSKRTLVVMATVPNTSIHVTFAFKHACNEDEEHTLLEEVKKEMGELLPIRCRFGDERMVGPNKDMPAYSIEICDQSTLERLQKFWHRHQRREEGARMFDFTPHITLKSDKKRKDADALKHQHNNGEFEIRHVVLRTLQDKKVLLELENSK